MNTYELYKLSNGEERFKGTQSAETSGKAKYKHYLEYSDCLPDTGFGEFVRNLHCRKIGKFEVNHLYGNQEQFERMCGLRNIPFAKLGMRIEVNDKMGTIVGSNNSLNLDVCFDEQHWEENCHPWWKTRYFDQDGNVIKEYLD